MIELQNDEKFLLDYIYLMYHVARIINIRTDITDKHMMTSIMVIEIWPSPSDVTSDFSRIICPFFRMLFLVSTSTLIWFPVKKKSNENLKGWNVLDRFQKVRIHKRFPYKSTLCTYSLCNSAGNFTSYIYTANVYRQTTDKLMFKGVISTVRWIRK